MQADPPLLELLTYNREWPVNSALPGRADWLRFGFRLRAYRKFRGRVFYCGFTIAEDAGNLAVGFTLGKPGGGGECDW